MNDVFSNASACTLHISCPNSTSLGPNSFNNVAISFVVSMSLNIRRDHIERRHDRMRLHGFEEFDLREHAEGSDQHHYVPGLKPVQKNYQGFIGFDSL
jgi:hypothetical protein